MSIRHDFFLRTTVFTNKHVSILAYGSFLKLKVNSYFRIRADDYTFTYRKKKLLFLLELLLTEKKITRKVEVKNNIALFLGQCASMSFTTQSSYVILTLINSTFST